MSRRSSSSKVRAKKKNIDYEGCLAPYLVEIDEVKLLTREEEQDLAKRASEGDSSAREKLIKANLRFVVNIAKKYQRKGLSLIDLINEGNMGLITAADKYDYTKGYHFISYAVWWIKQSILKALSEKTKLIRLPLNRANQLIRIEKLKKEKEQSKNSELSEGDIAEVLNISESNVSNILNASRDYVSLDVPIMFDKKERYLSETLKDNNSPNPDEIFFYESLKETIQKSLNTLSTKEKEVIKLRYGLGGQSLSLKEIGKKFNLTKERIRQIEKKAIRRLKHPSRSFFLKNFIRN